MLQDITFITAHFRDFEWTQLLVESICQNTPSESINEIIIVDQDRSEKSRSRLQTLNSKVRVVQYPKSEAHFLITQHDHSAVLNAAIKEAKGAHILVFDSDAHPIKSDYLKAIEDMLQLYDAILAEDPRCPGLTHPCFMLLKQEHIKFNLEFDKDLFTNKVDTGRLIGQQLRDAGEEVHICPAVPAFSGSYGTFYLGSIYHHGHGSFKVHSSDILKSQVTWEGDFFREYVLKHRAYKLNFLHLVKFRNLKLWKYLFLLPTRFSLKIRKLKDKSKDLWTSF